MSSSASASPPHQLRPEEKSKRKFRYYNNQEKAAILQIWSDEKRRGGGGRLPVPKDSKEAEHSRDLLTAQKWFHKKYGHLTDTELRAKLAARAEVDSSAEPAPFLTPEPPSKQSAGQTTWTRRSYRDAFRNAVQKAISVLPSQTEAQIALRNRLSELLDNKDRLFKKEGQARAMATKRGESFAEQGVVREDIEELWKSNKQEFMRYASYLFSAVFFAQEQRMTRAYPNETKSVSPSVLKQLSKSFEFQFHLLSPPTSTETVKKTYPFIIATPTIRNDHNSILAHTLSKIGSPGSNKTFQIDEAFYLDEEVHYQEDGTEVLPSIVCEYSKANHPGGILLSRLRSDAKLKGNGHLFSFYFFYSNPAPILLYCPLWEASSNSLSSGPSPPTMSIAKVLTGGAVGWRRYKTWRALIRSRVARDRIDTH